MLAITHSRTVVRSWGSLLHQRFIAPLFTSQDSISELAWGGGWGMLIGLTPLVGLQTYIIVVIWSILRGFKLHFNLPAAIAFLWISNPFTVLPLYYGYLITGNLALHGNLAALPEFSNFQEILVSSTQHPDASWLENLWQGMRSLFWNLGWPLLLGSFLWMIVLVPPTYFGILYGLHRYYRRFSTKKEISSGNT